MSISSEPGELERDEAPLATASSVCDMLSYEGLSVLRLYLPGIPRSLNCLQNGIVGTTVTSVRHEVCVSRAQANDNVATKNRQLSSKWVLARAKPGRICMDVPICMVSCTSMNPTDLCLSAV